MFYVPVVEMEIYGSALGVFAPNRPERLLSGDGYGVFERMIHKLKAESLRRKVLATG